MPPYKINLETVAQKMNILVYGNQGVGKTYFAATAQDHPALSPVLLLNMEGGLITLASRKDIEAEDIESIEHLESIFWEIANKSEVYAKYKTIIIDSVTELQTKNLEEVVQASIKKRGQQKTRTQDEVYQEDYGRSTTMLRRIFRNFRDCPVHTVMTALPKYKFPPGATETSSPAEVMPSLTTKLGDSLMGYVDFVWYMYKDEDARHLLTQDHGIYRAKTRGVKFAEALGTTISNPTLPKLYDLFMKSEGK